MRNLALLTLVGVFALIGCNSRKPPRGQGDGPGTAMGGIDTMGSADSMGAMDGGKATPAPGSTLEQVARAAVAAKGVAAAAKLKFMSMAHEIGATGTFEFWLGRDPNDQSGRPGRPVPAYAVVVDKQGKRAWYADPAGFGVFLAAMGYPASPKNLAAKQVLIAWFAFTRGSWPQVVGPASVNGSLKAKVKPPATSKAADGALVTVGWTNKMRYYWFERHEVRVSPAGKVSATSSSHETK